MIVLAGDEVFKSCWETILHIAQEHRCGWTLIGAQMVALHALEQGRNPPRISLDVDVLVNVRVLTRGTRQFSDALLRDGYQFEGTNRDQVGHRFVKEKSRIDVLAPDGLGPRTDLVTVPPAHTIQVPGGTQALRRTELVDVRLGRRVAHVPRPNLLGAILLKARAVGVDDVPQSQRSDLAFLLSLVSDPRSLAAELAAAERGWLRRRRELLDSSAPAWFGIPEAEDGVLALRLLSSTRH